MLNVWLLSVVALYFWVLTILMLVRRQGFWDQELRKLRECPAHLVGFIMRRAVCDASVALRVSFV